MAEYIKREAAIERLEKLFQLQAATARTIIDAIPAADVVEVRHGEWQPCKASVHPFGNNVRCSECGLTLGSSFGWNYCPNCGAKMTEV